MTTELLVTSLVTSANKTEPVFRTERGLTSCRTSSARAGTRTRMGLPPRDFKSLASTSFATRAPAA